MSQRSRAVSTRRRRERAILAGRVNARVEPTGENLTELRLLAETAGAEVLGEVLQRRGSVRSSTFLSKGKIDEVRALSEEQGATLLLLDDDLSPAQSRNLEEDLNLRVVDRSGLILDIFARRARTREARLQVELAQLEYIAAAADPACGSTSRVSEAESERGGPEKRSSKWTAAGSASGSRS